jgi:hypothetical protein
MKDFHNLTHKKFFFNGMESLTLSGRGSSFKGFFILYYIISLCHPSNIEFIKILYIGRVSHFDRCVLVKMVFRYFYFFVFLLSSTTTTTTISHTSKPFFITVLLHFCTSTIFFLLSLTVGKVERLHNLFLLI